MYIIYVYTQMCSDVKTSYPDVFKYVYLMFWLTVLYSNTASAWYFLQ